MIKKTQIITFLISSLFISSAFSQEINNTNLNKNNVQQSNNYTDAQIEYLNQLLKEQNYSQFFSTIKKINVSNSSYINYLNSKKYDGIIPIYWLIADYYANQKNYLKTHKWLYISLIMTQQDSYLCYDESARNAPRILLHYFPKTLDLTRDSPQYIEQVMPEVVFFIQNLKHRINPIWACSYGVNPPIKGNNILIPEANWSSTREQVLEHFAKNYQH